ncbi:unnamed protein product, partial [Didymodactylos carnosus]
VGSTYSSCGNSIGSSCNFDFVYSSTATTSTTDSQSCSSIESSDHLRQSIEEEKHDGRRILTPQIDKFIVQEPFIRAEHPVTPPPSKIIIVDNNNDVEDEETSSIEQYDHSAEWNPKLAYFPVDPSPIPLLSSSSSSSSFGEEHFTDSASSFQPLDTCANKLKWIDHLPSQQPQRRHSIANHETSFHTVTATLNDLSNCQSDKKLVFVETKPSLDISTSSAVIVQQQRFAVNTQLEKCYSVHSINETSSSSQSNRRRSSLMSWMSNNFKSSKTTKDKNNQTNSESNKNDDIETRKMNWAINFENLLADNVGLLLFKEFLQKIEYSNENIEFWLECEQFKTLTNHNEICQRAKSIWSDYFANNYPEFQNSSTLPLKININISDSTRQQCQQHLHKPHSSMFANAQAEIYRTMKYDSYPRFLESNLFKNYKSCDTNSLSGFTKPKIKRPRIPFPWTRGILINNT